MEKERREKKEEFLRKLDSTTLKRHGYEIKEGRLSKKLTSSTDKDKKKNTPTTPSADKDKPKRLKSKITTRNDESFTIPRLSVLEQFKRDMSGIKLRSTYPTPEDQNFINRTATSTRRPLEAQRSANALQSKTPSITEYR